MSHACKVQPGAIIASRWLIRFVARRFGPDSGNEFYADFLKQGEGQLSITDARRIARPNGPKIRTGPNETIGLGQHDPPMD